MNKIYKVIWNASLGIWVAVSEIAKGHSKTRSQRTNNALMPFTEATDFLQSSTSINFKIKPLTWGILTVLVPSITFGEVGVSGGFATGNNATAISACTGTGVGGTGDRATAGGERALAIGCGAVTDSDRDIAIGSQASTANPANATGTYNESIAIGAESRASGSQALAIGGQATATGNSSVAIGADDMDKVASTNPPAYNYTPTAGDNALYNNTATAAAYKNLTGDYLVDFEKTNGGASGIGNRYTRVQTGEAAVAVGPKATATDLGTALGAVATAGAPISVALGVKAEAQGQGSLSIGSLAYTKNTGDVAVGVNSAATGGDSIAIGAGSDLKGTAYVQSGASASKKGANASGANSISIGTNTAATGTNAVVVGTQSTASNLAVAVGSVATAGDQSVSIGSNSAASSQTSVAIGVRAQTLQTNSVALGSDSVADRASGSLGYDPLTETSTTNTNSTWKATDAAVSVGNGTTRTRQITSVAAGTNDTDAANVAQLKKATSKVLAGTGTTVAQGADSNGITTYTVNANTFTVRQGTTNKATIGDSTTDKVSFINGKNTVAKVADELNSNTDVTFDLADDISLNSVTTGNTTLNSSGVTVNGGANGPVKLTNTGLDNGGNKITNVAVGTVSSTSTDAVNGSQLNTTNQNVTTAQNTANTAVTNAAAAQATADKGLNFSVNGGTADNVKLGETVNFANGINTTAVYDSATNTYKYNVNDNIALTNAGSLTVGNTKVDNSGLTITGGPSVTTAGINAGNQKITNVAAGTLSSTSTDAVNGSQLNTTNQNVTTAQNTANTAVTNAAAAQATADKGLNFSVNGGTADNVKLGETVNFANGTNTTATYDPATNTYKYSVNDNIALTNAGSLTVGNTKVDNSGLTITGGPSVTTAGINAGTQKITNVKAGTNATDAVNFSQLNATNQNVTTAQNTANTALTNAAAAQATADKGLNFSVNGGTTDNVKLGETVNFADGANTTAVYDPATNTYKYNVNDNIALTNAGSLTVGNTKVDNNGLTITGGPSVTTTGINAGNQKITNVAAGTISATSTDAVNGSQLYTTNQNVTTAQNTANTAVMNAAAAQATADKGLNFSVNGGTADNVKLGETVNFADGTNTTAVYDPATNTYKYNVNDNITLTNAGSLTVGNSKVDNSGLTITGGPSVTTVGINAGNQKITNVAAGTISATSTDAVNGSQLNTTNQNVTTAQNTANTAVTNAAAAQATADKGLNFSVNGGTPDNVKLGETVNFADGTNTTAVYDPATNTYKYNVNDNIALTNAGSLTVGNTKVDNSGLTITGGPSVTTVGINAGNQKITNVAAGTNATDAVNVSQLGAITTAANTRTDALGISTASNLGGGAVYNPVTGAVSSPIYSVNGTNVNNVGDAITALDKGWTLQSNGANAGAVKAGDSVDIGTVAGESNLKVTKTGNKIQYGLNRDLSIDSVTAGDSKLDTNGLTIAGGPSVTKSGIDAASQKITNVAAGTISASSTDAVNGSQLNTTNQNVTTAQNTANTAVTNAAAAQATADKGLNFSVNGGTADNVKLGETVNFADGTNTTAVYDPATNTYKYNVNDNIALTNAGSLTVGNTKVDNSGLSITGGPSVTTAGINAGNQKITNVAAGTNPTDAVNVSQLGAITTAANTKTDALGTSTASNLGGGAVYNPVTGAVSSPIYSVNGTNVNNVGDAITALDKGWTLQSNGANAGAVKAGDTVDIGTVAGESNLKVTKTGNKIQYGLNRDLNVDSVTAGNSKLDTNGLTIAGGPSVTKSGIDAASQKITNVAAGTISATSTDAVNGSQLHTLDSRVTKNGDSIANIFGGGAKANPDGSISNPSYNVAGTSANNVGDALTALDKAVTDAGRAANTGWTVLANGDAATAKKIKPNGKVNFTGDDNLTVAQTSETDNEGNIKVALNKNLKVDSVTTGTTVIDTTGVKVGDNVQLGSTGLIIAGGPSMTTSGINAGNKVITNVAAGVNTTDAVNKGQLDSAITNINNNVGALANSAVQYDKNADGTVNKDSVTFAGGANGTALKNVADGTVAAGSKDAVNGGQLWSVQQQVDKNTGDISNLQTDISNINNGKSGLVQQANKDAAITVGKDTGGTQVNVAGTAGDRTVTGVKAGAVTATSKDAVNGSQLNTTNQALVNYLGGGAGYDNITQSFSNPTYNVGDKSYNNVGDAIGALNQADQTLNTKIDSVTNKLEQAFYSTNQRIDKLEEKMSAGIAANAALENAPFIPGKVTMAVGAAYYNEQNAVGVTLRKTADNGRWSLTTGASLGSQGSPLVRVGVSTVID
ncbi:ESPR-type extended signal peptide-containing protein [Acinetobacter nosocomialis]|uniref:ESPR-type extended signal peptide-containing protein n=1 Tax=Acinetobacter nosocomialis TaxID=106654 RepID=UPI0026EBBA5B|nr:ESPR-type extended signal peptide-containing protein [Acinetobacter nosocomialis]MDO7219989.1 ESPR-type extended signal peptide-containing protein [Acinetobacter nosocomialis]